MSDILKNKVYRKELVRFITEGLLIVFVFGATLGFLDILLTLTGVMTILTFFTSFIFYIFLNRRLFKIFSTYFKIYSILAVIFVIVGFYVMRVSGLLALTVLPDGIKFSVIFFDPLFAFNLYLWNDLIQILINILNILFFVIIAIFTYRNMKRQM